MGQVDSYVNRILESQESEGVANEILKSIQRDDSLEDLDAMLVHSNQRIVEAAVWILAELAQGGRSLLHRIRKLKDSDSMRVRFSAIDVVLLCATENDQDLIAWALDACKDREASVRWKAMVYMENVPESDLTSVLRWMNERTGWDEHKTGLKWLLSGPDTDFQDLAAPPSSNSPVLSSYAAATAARYFSLDPRFLRRLAKGPKSEFQNYAKDMLARFELSRDNGVGSN